MDNARGLCNEPIRRRRSCPVVTDWLAQRTLNQKHADMEEDGPADVGTGLAQTLECEPSRP
eukprot:6761048-Lingulodinium_polyedra.AAC.1